MKLKKVALKDLVSPDYNPREISDKEMVKLKRSITELGYSEPIIVNDVNNVIISGNQRYRALQELGTEEIEVIFIHEPVLAREKALNIALNKIDGEWDNSKLVTLINEIELDGLDTNLTGFDEIELTDILVDEEYIIPDDEPEFGESIADDIETIICPSCGYEIPKH